VCAIGGVEADRNCFRDDVLLDPILKRLERAGRLPASTTGAMREARDFEVAIEVFHCGIEVLNATVIVGSGFVRDEPVGLDKRGQQGRQKRGLSCAR
jgi:hypothetical protein